MFKSLVYFIYSDNAIQKGEDEEGLLGFFLKDILPGKCYLI